MKNMKTKFLTIVLVVLATIGFAFMPTVNKITLKGSDTMVILTQKWAEVYMKNNPSSQVQVTGGGSGVGISALINGSTDIAASSRPMKSTEIQKLKDRYNSYGVEIPVAKDGISIYVHQSNSIKELTIAQLSGIFSGKITNWKQVGGANAPITIYGRENSSGTYVFFKDNVVKADYAATCQTLPGTAAVVNAVKKDKFGIGYGGAAYANGIKDVAVKKDDKSIAYLPTAANIKSNSYPISRYLYLYMANKPVGETKKFIDWILGPEGQKLVVSVGYFPVR